MNKRAIAVIGIRGIPANYGGLETCAEYVTRSWVKSGYSVLVYCRSNRYPQKKDSVDGVRLKYVSAIPSKSLETLSHTLLSILNLLITERDIKTVHLYNTGNAIFLPLLKLFRKTVVLSGDGVEWKREKWGFLARSTHKVGERFAVWMADSIVVDNAEVGRYYRETYGAETDEIAYGAKLIEKDAELSKRILSKLALREKDYYLFVGRLVPEKGVHHLIEAYKKLQTSRPLVIIGDDVHRSEYKAGLFAHESPMIRFLGFMYGGEFEQVLASALMYVSASKLEGTSPALLEAMGAKVCALVNGIEENVATVRGNAVTFRKNDYEDLRFTWQGLIDNPVQIDKFATDGFNYTYETYRWEEIANRYLAVFERFARKLIKSS